jgi:hypothetical protein
MRDHIRYAACGLLLALALTTSAFADTTVKVEADGSVAGSDVRAKGQLGASVAFNWAGDTITLRPLDDPGNPYLSEYTDVDRWVYTNVRTDWTPDKLVWQDGRWILPAGADPDWRVVPVRVDRQGYIVPQYHTTNLTMGPVAPDVLPGDDYYYVFAAGPGDDEVLKVYDDERVTRVATVFPDVPDWLIKQPAERVVLVPNNEYVVMSNGTWVRYDAAGKVVAKAPAGTTTWRSMYWPTFADAVRAANGKGWKVIENDGYVIFRDADGSIVEAYDYLGTPVKLDATVKRHPYYFTPLSFDEVKRVRDAKVRVKTSSGGKTDVKVKVDK